MSCPSTVRRGCGPLVFGAGVYGGYFGAAQGVLLMAILGIGVADDDAAQQRHQERARPPGQLVAAIVFIVVADVDWAVAGADRGRARSSAASIGATVGRRLPPRSCAA